MQSKTNDLECNYIIAGAEFEKKQEYPEIIKKGRGISLDLRYHRDLTLKSFQAFEKQKDQNIVGNQSPYSLYSFKFDAHKTINKANQQELIVINCLKDFIIQSIENLGQAFIHDTIGANTLSPLLLSIVNTIYKEKGEKYVEKIAYLHHLSGYEAHLIVFNKGEVAHMITLGQKSYLSQHPEPYSLKPYTLQKLLELNTTPCTELVSLPNPLIWLMMYYLPHGVGYFKDINKQYLDVSMHQTFTIKMDLVLYDTDVPWQCIHAAYVDNDIFFVGALLKSLDKSSKAFATQLITKLDQYNTHLKKESPLFKDLLEVVIGGKDNRPLLSNVMSAYNSMEAICSEVYNGYGYDRAQYNCDNWSDIKSYEKVLQLLDMPLLRIFKDNFNESIQKVKGKPTVLKLINSLFNALSSKPKIQNFDYEPENFNQIRRRYGELLSKNPIILQNPYYLEDQKLVENQELGSDNNQLWSQRIKGPQEKTGNFI